MEVVAEAGRWMKEGVALVYADVLVVTVVLEVVFWELSVALRDWARDSARLRAVLRPLRKDEADWRVLASCECDCQ